MIMEDELQELKKQVENIENYDIFDNESLLSELFDESDITDTLRYVDLDDLTFYKKTGKADGFFYGMLEDDDNYNFDIDGSFIKDCHGVRYYFAKLK